MIPVFERQLIHGGGTTVLQIGPVPIDQRFRLAAMKRQRTKHELYNDLKKAQKKPTKTRSKKNPGKNENEREKGKNQ